MATATQIMVPLSQVNLKPLTVVSLGVLGSVTFSTEIVVLTHPTIPMSKDNIDISLDGGTTKILGSSLKTNTGYTYTRVSATQTVFKKTDPTAQTITFYANLVASGAGPAPPVTGINWTSGASYQETGGTTTIRALSSGYGLVASTLDYKILEYVNGTLVQEWVASDPMQFTWVPPVDIPTIGTHIYTVTLKVVLRSNPSNVISEITQVAWDWNNPPPLGAD
jgi:hypothetical protein